MQLASDTVVLDLGRKTIMWNVYIEGFEVKSCIVLISCDLQKRCFLKPCCSWQRRPCWSRWFITGECMICFFTESMMKTIWLMNAWEDIHRVGYVCTTSYKQQLIIDIQQRVSKNDASGNALFLFINVQYLPQSFTWSSSLINQLKLKCRLFHRICFCQSWDMFN